MRNKIVKPSRKIAKRKSLRTFSVFVSINGLDGIFKVNVYASSKRQARERAKGVFCVRFTEPNKHAMNFYNVLPINDECFFSRHPHDVRN